MCSAPPLCKFWSGHGCEWQPNFVAHSPPFQICPWMLSGDLPPQQPGFIQLSRNGQHFFFLGQAKVLFCVLSLYTRTSIFVYVRGVFWPPVLEGLCLCIFFFYFFPPEITFCPKKGISCGPGCGIFLAFRGTEEKIKASLSCLDKRRKIKSCSNLILPKREDRHKRICQREESLIIKGEEQ